jgi:hypothetical protein
MSQKWDFLVNPSAEVSNATCKAFAESLGNQLHSSVLESLGRNKRDSKVAKNFLMSHETYLYGVVSIPSSSSDGLADFIQVTLLACEEKLLTFVNGETSSNSIGDIFIHELQELTNNYNNSGGSVGGAINNLLASSCSALESYLGEIKKILDCLDFGGNLLNTGQLLNSCETELRSVQPVMTGLNRIADDIANDVVDLKLRSGGQLFPRDLEIESRVMRLSIDQLDLILQELLKRVDAGYNKINLHYSESNSQNMHFVLALIVLAVSPILLLNIYSTFFAEGERWSNSLSAQFFWVPIGLIFLVELFYFKKIKWLNSAKKP